MGIPGLWPTVSDVGVHKSLCAHLTELKIKNPDQPMRVGVDMSTLMAECTGATLAGGIHGQFTGGALYILFTKLAEYLQSPANPLFVFDGRGRPPVKRGHSVRHKPLHWEPLARVLIRNFGFHVHDAPGEAEAELAKLNELGLIDGVITSDGDIFVFGGRTVFRSLPRVRKTNYKDEIALYTGQALQEIGLSPGGLLLFALLCGGDYDSGIEGCGAMTAYGLAKCGYGDTLVTGLDTFHGGDLDVFLSSWRDDLRRELRSNARQLLESRQPAVASHITDSFPKEDILNFYRNPLTSWSSVPPNIPNHNAWVAREPSLHDLAAFCTDNFHWSAEDVVMKFSNLIWKGALMQMFYSPLVLYDDSRRLLCTPNYNVTILQNKRIIRQGKLGNKSDPQPRLVASPSNFITMMGMTVTAGDVPKVSVWIPEALLPEGLKKLPTKKSTPKKRRAPAAQPVASGSQTHHTTSESQAPPSAQPLASGSRTGGTWLGPIIDLTGDSDLFIFLPARIGR